MASKSLRQGGLHSRDDVFTVPRSGEDGKILNSIWGASPKDFEDAIEYELQRRAGSTDAREVEILGSEPKKCDNIQNVSEDQLG
jgi:hypothetical protein